MKEKEGYVGWQFTWRVARVNWGNRKSRVREEASVYFNGSLCTTLWRTVMDSLDKSVIQPNHSLLLKYPLILWNALQHMKVSVFQVPPVYVVNSKTEYSVKHFYPLWSVWQHLAAKREIVKLVFCRVQVHVQSLNISLHKRSLRIISRVLHTSSSCLPFSLSFHPPSPLPPLGAVLMFNEGLSNWWVQHEVTV